MSPQPTAAPASPAVTAMDEAHKTPEDKRSSGHRQIVRAVHLEKLRSDLMEQVTANRDYLRLMEKNGELNEAQTAFRKTFYPDKEKGESRDKDEIEATRKLRETARKGYAA